MCKTILLWVISLIIKADDAYERKSPCTNDVCTVGGRGGGGQKISKICRLTVLKMQMTGEGPRGRVKNPYKISRHHMDMLPNHKSFT